MKKILLILFIISIASISCKTNSSETFKLSLDDYKIEIFQYAENDVLPETYDEIDRSKMVLRNDDLKKMNLLEQFGEYNIYLVVKDKGFLKEITKGKTSVFINCINCQIISRPIHRAGYKITDGWLPIVNGDEEYMESILKIDVPEIQNKRRTYFPGLD